MSNTPAHTHDSRVARFEEALAATQSLNLRQLVSQPHVIIDKEWIEQTMIDAFCTGCPKLYYHGDGYTDCDHWIYDRDCYHYRDIRRIYETICAAEEVILHGAY